jgi:hypothetical protein
MAAASHLPSVCIAASPGKDDIGLPATLLESPSDTLLALVVRWPRSSPRLPPPRHLCCALASMLPTVRHSCRSGRMSYNAWNRRVLLCLAHTYSLRWSCRTFSSGFLAVSSMPSHLPPHKHDQSKAPSLQRVVLHAFLGTSGLSDSLPAPRDFSLPALYPRSLPDLAAR